MLERLRSLRRTSREPHDDLPPDTAPVFTGLRLFSAELLFSTGVNATLHYLRSRSGPPHRSHAGRGAGAGWTATAGGPDGHQGSRAGAWAPLVLGSLGCAAQATLALRPSDRAQLATRVLSGLVLGLGAAGTAEEVRASLRGDAPFTGTTLLFGYSGLLSLLLDRQEAAVAEEEETLSRRASLFDRLIPERRTKIERIVVHV